MARSSENKRHDVNETTVDVVAATLVVAVVVAVVHTVAVAHMCSTSVLMVMMPCNSSNMTTKRWSGGGGWRDGNDGNDAVDAQQSSLFAITA